MLQRIYPIVLLSIFSINIQASLLISPHIHSSGGFSTIDYRFFTFNLEGIPDIALPPAGEDFSFNFDRIEAFARLIEHPDGIILPDFDFIIYTDDGTFSNVVFQNNDVQDNGGSIAASINNFVVHNRGANVSTIDTNPIFFFDTNYVLAIGAHPLAVGETGAFHAHENERLDPIETLQYDFNLSTNLDGIYSSDCFIHGELDGSYSSPNTASCNLSRLGIDESDFDPNQSVPEPTAVYNILLGMIGLLLISSRRKKIQIKATII